MGFCEEWISFYCKNAHKSRKYKSYTGFHIDDSKIDTFEDLHYYINDKNFAYVFAVFRNCPICGDSLKIKGKTYKKLVKEITRITDRKIKKGKAEYIYSFVTHKKKCKLTVGYNFGRISPSASYIVEDWLISQTIEIFKTFEHCPFCGKECKGITDITKYGEHRTYEIKH